MNKKHLLVAVSSVLLAACTDIQAPAASLELAGSVADSRDAAPFIAFALSATENHTCAFAPGGSLQCWGFNRYGQVGTGSTDQIVATPARVSGAFEQVSVGGYHTCALDASGAAYCWGENISAALGNGTTDDSRTPVAVDTELRFVSIAAGNKFTCALTAAGAAYCWGSGGHGQLGTPATETCTRAGGLNVQCATRPVAVGGGHVFAALETGLWNGCGLTSGGAAYCWGNDSFGQRGIARSAVPGSTPTQVRGGHAFQSISVGALHMCALTTASQAYCWGNNWYGQLGNGTTTASSEPTLAAGGRSYASVVAGDGNVIFAHSCGIAADGVTYCWGANSAGQLGTSAPLGTCGPAARLFRPCSPDPIAVDTELRFTTVDLGSEYTCGITDGRRAYCWGSNEAGQLGAPSVVTTSTPTPVATWERGMARGRPASAGTAPTVTGLTSE